MKRPTDPCLFYFWTRFDNHDDCKSLEDLIQASLSMAELSEINLLTLARSRLMFQLPLYPFLSLSVLIVRRVAICVLKAMWHENVNSCLCRRLFSCYLQRSSVMRGRPHSHAHSHREEMCSFTVLLFSHHKHTYTRQWTHTQTLLWSCPET